MVPEFFGKWECLEGFGNDLKEGRETPPIFYPRVNAGKPTHLAPLNLKASEFQSLSKTRSLFPCCAGILNAYRPPSHQGYLRGLSVAITFFFFLLLFVFLFVFFFVCFFFFFFLFFFKSVGRGAMKLTSELGKISSGSKGVAQRRLGRPAQGH